MQGARFLFIVPDQKAPSGGTAVLYDCAVVLDRLGHDAVMLHESPSGAYVNATVNPKRAYCGAIRRARWRRGGVFRRLRARLKHAIDVIRGGANPHLRPSHDDVLVVPEYLLDLAHDAYPLQRKVVFVQNPFAYTRACAEAMRRGMDPQSGVVRTLCASRACMEGAEAAGAGPVSYVPVTPDLTRFGYCEDKARKIAYMPRKRGDEAIVMADALRRRGRIGDFELVEIDGRPQAEVARILRESLVFVSLMKDEGLGFPAIEAMSSGCVTIGYVALGAREFFDVETGIPVEDGDTLALVKAVEAVVAEYDADPSRLDALRATASAQVRERYARPVFEQALQEAWQSMVAR